MTHWTIDTVDVIFYCCCLFFNFGCFGCQVYFFSEWRFPTVFTVSYRVHCGCFVVYHHIFSVASDRFAKC